MRQLSEKETRRLVADHKHGLVAVKLGCQDDVKYLWKYSMEASSEGIAVELYKGTPYIVEVLVTWFPEQVIEEEPHVVDS